MIKTETVKEDGRTLIYYTFPPDNAPTETAQEEDHV